MRSRADPSPASSKSEPPQHSTRPEVSSAQVCIIPPTIAVACSTPATRTGTALSSQERLPSWPWLFSPQQ